MTHKSPQSRSRSKMARHLLPAALCLTIGALASLAMGQDANWDLLNYHLYNGFAALHGRFSQDLLAAGMQSYLNPVLDALYTALALGPLRHALRILAAVTGLWYGMVIFLAYRLATLLSSDVRNPGVTRPAIVTVIAATMLSVSGAATISQVGTTTEELQVAVVMLAGLLVMMQGATPHPDETWRETTSLRRVAGGGLLFGLAAGLKLTAAVYAPAALLAAMSLHSAPSSRSLRWMATGAAFVAGWLVGLTAADGWWAVMLERRFSSPTFPMFNGLFRSSLYPPASLLDGRFLPHGVLQWLFYPIFWASTPMALVSELPLRDPRLGFIRS